MPDTPKGKPPSFPFYPGDWLREVTLRKSCLATRGAWADLLSFMWLEQTWQWEGTTKELARCLGTTTAAAYRAAKELVDNGVANGDVTLCNKNIPGCKADVTLISRRLYRLFYGRELTAARVREHRKRHSNDDVTAENRVPSSSSPSSLAGKTPQPPRKRGAVTPTASPRSKLRQLRQLVLDRKVDHVCRDGTSYRIAIGVGKRLDKLVLLYDPPPQGGDGIKGFITRDNVEHYDWKPATKENRDASK